ncbi:MAG: peptidyl-prolyl cis-trans isomerase [Gammaproteobacteria bacterium]|nr:peptidyl-prolyl cis-trans isomerase [Gammaproteobacteria bacterium]
MSLQSKLLLSSIALGTTIALFSIIDTNKNYVKLPNHVLAIVNDVVIEKNKLDIVLDLMAQDKKERLTKKDQALAIERIIEEELLVQYAYSNGLLNADENIRKTIIRSVIDTVVDQVIAIKPNEQVLKDFYLSNQPIFTLGEEVKIIVLNIKSLDDANNIIRIWKETKNESLLLIKDTIRQSTIPNDFIPSITLPRLIGPKLAKVVDRLELYSISKPIENYSDYSVVILKDRKNKKTPDYKNIKQTVLQEYKRRMREDILSNLVADLEKKAEIRINTNLN